VFLDNIPIGARSDLSVKSPKTLVVFSDLCASSVRLCGQSVLTYPRSKSSTFIRKHQRKQRPAKHDHFREARARDDRRQLLAAIRVRPPRGKPVPRAAA
jgi:hypothetical protein